MHHEPAPRPAFDPPYRSEELASLPPLLATEPPPATSEITVASVMVSGAHGEPHISHRITPIHSETGVYRVDTVLTGGNFHSHPRALKIPGRRFDPTRVSVPGWSSEPYRPRFRDLRYVPAAAAAPMPRQVRTRKGVELEPYIIYPPDRRYVFDDTSYPWCTVGAVYSVSLASGVLVGPRHMLTASHAIDWQPDGSFGQVRFVPASFDAQARFGTAYATAIYYYRRLAGGPQNSDDVAEDYVVCVLDTPMGDLLGWMGSRVYDDDWNDQPYWSHIGYSIDIGNGGLRPSYQDQATFDDADGPGFLGTGDGLDMRTRTGDVTYGDSGGPFFEFWPDGPYVVGVTSAGSPVGNWCGGGEPMVNMIRQARRDDP